MAFLLDTTFLVDLQRNEPKAERLLDQLIEEESPLVVPTIVLGEFLTRSSDPRADTGRILDTCVVLEFTVEDAQNAARIAAQLMAKGTFPGWSDVFIAGIAENRGLAIITRGAKHFPLSQVRTY